MSSLTVDSVLLQEGRKGAWSDEQWSLERICKRHRIVFETSEDDPTKCVITMHWQVSGLDEMSRKSVPLKIVVPLEKYPTNAFVEKVNVAMPGSSTFMPTHASVTNCPAMALPELDWTDDFVPQAVRKTAGQLFANGCGVHCVQTQQRKLSSAVSNVSAEDVVKKESFILSIMGGLNTLDKFLPKLLEKCVEKPWDEDEQKKLEQALVKFPSNKFEQNPNERWKAIANFVNTRTAPQCRQRFLFLAAAVKSGKEEELMKNLSQKGLQSQNQNQSVLLNYNNNNISNNNNNNSNNVSTGGLDQAVLVEPPLSVSADSLQLQHLLMDNIGIFQLMASSFVVCCARCRTQNVLNLDFTVPLSMAEKERQRLERAEKKQKEKEKLKKEFHEMKQRFLVYKQRKAEQQQQQQQLFSTVHDKTVDGTDEGREDLNTKNNESDIDSSDFEGIDFDASDFSDEDNSADEEEEELDEFAVEMSIKRAEKACDRCGGRIRIRVEPSLCHAENPFLGSVEVFQCSVKEWLAPRVRIWCGQCSSKKCVVSKFVPRSAIEMHCHQCYNHMKYSFSALVCGAFELKLHETRQFNKEIQNSIKKIKDDHRFQVGTPLPSNGSCEHFRKSRRWFRFPCCLRAFACPQCHNDNADHEYERANRFICGYCSKEQPIVSDKPCISCGQSVTGSRTTHWEGGQGCRDWKRMAASDPKKWKLRNAEMRAAKQQKEMQQALKKKKDEKLNKDREERKQKEKEKQNNKND